MASSKALTTPHGTTRMSAKGTHGGSKKHLRRMSIEPTMNGGVIVEHQFHQPSGSGYHDSEQHAFADRKSAMAHVNKHMAAAMPDDEMAEGEASE